MITEFSDGNHTGTLAIVHNSSEKAAICGWCETQHTLAVGPAIIERDSGTTVCTQCGMDEDEEFAALYFAARRWYPHYADYGEELSLRAALDLYPKGTWQTHQPTRNVWGTDDIITKVDDANSAAPVFDLDQSVLFIGHAVYPAVARRQVDVLPLLTLESEVRRASTLDDCLVASTHLWLALDGVCWTAEELRHQLTLGQRAREASGSQFVTFDFTEGQCEVICYGMSEMLFLLVDDLRHAQDAYISEMVSEMEIPGLRAAQLHGTSQQAEHIWSETRLRTIAEIRRVGATNLPAIENIVGASVKVRMARPGDLPFWAPSHPHSDETSNCTGRREVCTELHWEIAQWLKERGDA